VYLWRKNWIVLSNVVQEENLPFCPNGINFVDKDNGWGKLISNTKEFSYQLGPSPKYFCISSVPNSNPMSLLLDCTSCIGANNNPKQQNPSILSSPSCTHKAHLGKQCLSSPRFPVKDNTLRRLDTNVLIKFWMCERQLHCLLNLLNL
jgi:hypothetical protein